MGFLIPGGGLWRTNGCLAASSFSPLSFPAPPSSPLHAPPIAARLKSEVCESCAETPSASPDARRWQALATCPPLGDHRRLIGAHSLIALRSNCVQG